LFHIQESVELDAYVERYFEKFLSTFLGKILKFLLDVPDASTEEKLKTAIRALWFDEYDKDRTKMSGFEHVFYGEAVRNTNNQVTQIMGMHNWFRFQTEESRNSMVFTGSNNQLIVKVGVC